MLHHSHKISDPAIYTQEIIMGQRLAETPTLFTDMRSLWFPPMLPLSFSWWRLCRKNFNCNPLYSSSLAGPTCRIFLQPIHDILKGTCNCPTLCLSSHLAFSCHQSRWSKRALAGKYSQQCLSLWVRTAHASCHTWMCNAWRLGMFRAQEPQCTVLSVSRSGMLVHLALSL